MSSPSEIVDGLWIGDAITANNARFFADNNIVAVVNCTPTVPLYFEKSGVKYMRIPVNDSATFDSNSTMSAYIPYAVQFIQRSHHSKDRGILVHCHAGISRSCTVAVAYLRHCCTLSLKEAVDLVVQKRPIAFIGGTMFNFRLALHSIFSY